MKRISSQSETMDERGGFRFRGGHPVVDLPATLLGRLKTTQRELLRTHDDVAHWLLASRLTSVRPDTGENDLDIARGLREAIYALATSRVLHAADNSNAREALNRIAALPAAIPCLDAAGSMRLTGTAAQLLATLAREAVHLFGGDMAAHIRQCQSPGCTHFFVDTSRSGERRWCSMAACGNKAKVAAFRRRKREDTQKIKIAAV
jgi:predicted RNA-binding Zn ribbon-like protein